MGFFFGYFCFNFYVKPVRTPNLPAGRQVIESQINKSPKCNY